MNYNLHQLDKAAFEALMEYTEAINDYRTHRHTIERRFVTTQADIECHKRMVQETYKQVCQLKGKVPKTLGYDKFKEEVELFLVHHNIPLPLHQVPQAKATTKAGIDS